MSDWPEAVREYEKRHSEERWVLPNMMPMSLADAAIAALKAEVERMKGLLAHEQAKNFQYEAEKAEPGRLLAEVERLKWMLHQFASGKYVAYQPQDELKWGPDSEERVMADLAARYEKEEK